MAEVLPVTTGLLMGEVAREATGKVVGEATMGAREATAIPTMAEPEMGSPASLLPTATIGNNSQLHDFPPCASQVPDPLIGRPIDCTSQCSQERPHLLTCESSLLI